TQMHIWGSARVEWLRWAWVPRFDSTNGGGGALEITAVAAKAEPAAKSGKRDPQHLCAMWLRLGDGPDAEVIDNSGLTKTMRASVRSIRPGVLHHVAAGNGRRIV
ncbi:MAG: hypothetical protein KC431_22135, partial [Myxococcales bacterium]|nr:hypothetical protein [Myxococcales bacterium]